MWEVVCWVIFWLIVLTDVIFVIEQKLQLKWLKSFNLLTESDNSRPEHTRAAIGENLDSIWYILLLIFHTIQSIIESHWRIGVIRSINLSDLKIEQKTKVVQDPRFFLRFFSPAHFGHQKPRYASYVPCDPVTRSWSKLEISK